MSSMKTMGDVLKTKPFTRKFSVILHILLCDQFHLATGSNLSKHLPCRETDGCQVVFDQSSHIKKILGSNSLTDWRYVEFYILFLWLSTFSLDTLASSNGDC